MEKRNKIKNVDKNINSMGIRIVGFILSTIAGWVDAIGVKLFLKQRSSSMTGRGHMLGKLAYKSEFKMFLGIALIIVAFILGAFISTIIAERRGLVGSLLMTGILILISSIPFVFQHSVFLIIFLPMSMGCQNAGTSLTAIRRTTHLTGASTDMGINMAKGNWQVVRFWLYRLIGFPLGALVGFNLADLANRNVISASITLIIPAFIVVSIGIIQDKLLDIPILEESLKTN